MAFERNQAMCRFTPEEFEEAVDNYITEQIGNERIPTVKHFALMNNVSRQQMQVKYKEDPKYSEAFGRLRDARDGMLEYMLVNPSERSPATLIFASKNWLGMTDKSVVEQKTTHSMSETLAEKLAGGSLE